MERNKGLYQDVCLCTCAAPLYIVYFDMVWWRTHNMAATHALSHIEIEIDVEI